MTVISRALIAAVRGYQRIPRSRPGVCRYVPSCSTYAIEAIEHRGAVAGLILAIRRLGRCHPWGRQGYDPVPGTDPEHDATRAQRSDVRRRAVHRRALLTTALLSPRSLS